MRSRLHRARLYARLVAEAYLILPLIALALRVQGTRRS